MLTHRSTLASLFLAAAVAAAPAHAREAHLSAAISGFKIELIDLDLTDNIAPSLTFDYGGRTAFSFYNEELIAPQRKTLSKSGTVAITRPNGSTSATLDTTGLSSATDLVHNSNKWVDYESKAESYEGFILSPNTGLFVTALGSISAENDGMNSAVSEVNLLVSLYNTDDGVSGSRYFIHNFSTGDGAREYTMSGYLASGPTAQRATISMRATTRLWASSPVPSVPEPTTYGMLLAGGLLVGAMARRRRQR